LIATQSPRSIAGLQLRVSEESMRKIFALALLSLAFFGGVAVFAIADASRAIACDYHGS
jgi:hypothetical protein